MELEIKRIDFNADSYDVRKAVEVVLHGTDLYDPHDTKNKGRKPNFQVQMGESPAGRHHNGTAILRLPQATLGRKLLRWVHDAPSNNIVVNGGPLRVFNSHRRVAPDIQQTLEKALYIGPEQDKAREDIIRKAYEVRPRIAKIQFGVWYRPPNTPANHGILFTIQLGQRETEDDHFFVLVKFSSIKKLGLGYDEFGLPYIIFDLYTPPHFEQESFNGYVREDTKRKKNRARLSALDDGHARVAPFAHHLRVVLAEIDDLLRFEDICRIAQCEPRPVRVPRVDALAQGFFSHRYLHNVHRWLRTMPWKNAFQIESYLRSGLINTHDLLFSLQQPIEEAMRDYGEEASEFLRIFAVALRMRDPAKEAPAACLARMRRENKTVKPLKLSPGHFSCHHIVITPTRMLFEGPYTTQSNRVIRRFQSHDAKLVEHFIRVEFRDEDHLNYRWSDDVDGTSFLQSRVGGILRDGLELSGRSFEFLAYSTSALREHAVWFVSPFRDPVEGFVTAETIRASLGDFSQLLRTPSKYAARIAQAFTATDPSVMLYRGQWEDLPEIGVHTDGVGTVSPELAHKIWEAICGATPGNLRETRVEPSAYQFRFLGYKGVVVVDSSLEGIRLRLRDSQRKFPVHNVEKAEFEVARAFSLPNAVHLNRPAVMALEDRGVRKDAFMELQEMAKVEIYLAGDSLENFVKLLKKHSLGHKFHLAFVLEQLDKLKLDMKANLDKRAVGSAFLGRLLRFGMNHCLREVKHNARIPVPQSYQLVGVADEGQAWIEQDGLDPKDVFTLGEGYIYACIQESADSDPVYLKGSCVISRSPVIHPGDVQRVHAVGEPPKGVKCFFRGLKNVVVMPAVGKRSLASCLAGGDLDGDTFDIYWNNPQLLPTDYADAAEYPPGQVRRLPDDRPDATVDDICDFIVEYINSDVMGLLADKHIIIADQSRDGVFDNRCMRLAELCSQAVDYAKNGVAVDLSSPGALPKQLIKFKPDWKKAEVTGARDLDYYESDRALGFLYRNISLEDPNEPVAGVSAQPPAPLQDPISCALAPLVQSFVGDTDADGPTPAPADADADAQAEALHARHVREMRFICTTHALIDAPDVRLMEEEVVLGTILADCTQKHARSERAFRMRTHAETLVRDLRALVVPVGVGVGSEAPPGVLRAGLRDAWGMWGWAQRNRDADFIESFSLVVLGIVLDCLKRLAPPEVMA
ncbi:RNA dependent RNA polymerase-domain-containing protein [Gloeopeniophorella convolvens]|nr:RNA dependent RNA polymerase-domain-containing protein [Gloeopeniophorella convolvens]